MGKFVRHFCVDCTLEVVAWAALLGGAACAVRGSVRGCVERSAVSCLVVYCGCMERYRVPDLSNWIRRGKERKD